MAFLCPFSDMATKANTGGCRCYPSSPTPPHPREDASTAPSRAPHPRRRTSEQVPRFATVAAPPSGTEAMLMVTFVQLSHACQTPPHLTLAVAPDAGCAGAAPER